MLLVRSARSALRLVAATAVATACVLPLSHASADTQPTTPGIPATVSADPLPTVQIDGVVWSQAVVGNTVYAAGSFKTARPAGAAAGTQTTVRNNLLAYDITTGNLITSFAPDLNGQALTVTASPDGSRIYVGGQFTVANGKTRSRIAAYDTATGELVSGFAPIAATTVRTITATNTAVYFGGDFTQVNGTPRNYIAAADSATGTLLPFAPKASATVTASTMTGDGSKLIIGGRFTSVDGKAVRGMAALDPTTGSTLPWAASSVITNSGINSALTSLTADATSVYGTGYSYTVGMLEGAFRADASTGKIVWMEDCHGDSYGIYPTADVAYVASHAHDCATLGLFPDVYPDNYRATAFTNKATGTLKNNQVVDYANYGGQPAPTMLHFFPTLWPGTFTGQGQAAWSVTGNSQYVVYAGEFNAVNATYQQGIVRFPAAAIAPNKVGPTTNTKLKPTVSQARRSTSVTVKWGTTYDRDNANLVYKVYRNYVAKTDTPICTVSNSTPFWKPLTLSCTDTTAPKGQAVRYRVIASDPFGNIKDGGDTTFTTRN